MQIHYVTGPVNGGDCMQCLTVCFHIICRLTVVRKVYKTRSEVYYKLKSLIMAELNQHRYKLGYISVLFALKYV